jgi:hypothetical protein
MTKNPRHLLAPDPASHDDDGRAALSEAVVLPGDIELRIETDRAPGHQPTLKPVAPASKTIPTENMAAELLRLRAENATMKARLSALARHLQQLANETSVLIDPEADAARQRIEADHLRRMNG